MQPDELVARGTHAMTVCNACRYCERYCPVFPAMEDRFTFAKADLVYLANLCHNCGECLYACQYAPPHEFGINVPRTLSEVRLHTYEEYCWPRWLAASFRHSGLGTGLGLAAALTGVMFAWTAAVNGAALWRAAPAGDFYAVVPHGVMVAVFGGVFLFAALAMGVAVTRFRRDLRRSAPEFAAFRDGPRPSRRRGAPALRALRDALTLRHLHATGADCTAAEESRTPWRRWFHHCTFYGFALCFASTSVAALYHLLGWPAPYDYTSLPVLLGTAGGVGLLVGPAGLLAQRCLRDPTLGDPAQRGLDEALVALLFLTSLTGLGLLALRDTILMGTLLIVHLGVVLALFLTLPYGKFVHALYRMAALAKYAREAGDSAI